VGDREQQREENEAGERGPSQSDCWVRLSQSYLQVDAMPD
jgi:hypothetical protein